MVEEITNVTNVTYTKKKAVNLNDLAVEVSKMEGGVKEMNIAQIKECMKCIFIALNKCESADILEIVDRTADKYRGD